MLRAALTLTLGLAACLPPPGDEGPPAPGGVSRELVWIKVIGPYQGPSRFVTLERGGEVVAAETTGPNLETAGLTALRRGRVGVDTWRPVFAAVGETDWELVPEASPEEAIEEAREILRLAFATTTGTWGPRTLYRDALPPPSASALDSLLAAAGALPPAPAGGLVSASPVSAERGRRLRQDPRAFYRFVALEAADLAAAPATASAVAHPEAVFLTDAEEAGGLEAWLERSNPRGLGDTLFLTVAGGNGGRDYQIQLKRWPASSGTS